MGFKPQYPLEQISQRKERRVLRVLELRHSQRVWGSWATCSFSIWTNLDFPMPASPVSKTTCP